MLIDKAIKELQEEVDSGIDGTMFSLCNAMMLGIEALKIIKKERRDLLSYAGELLDGETEE